MEEKKLYGDVEGKYPWGLFPWRYYKANVVLNRKFMANVAGLKARREIAQCQGQLSNELCPTAVLPSLNSPKRIVPMCHGSRPLFVLKAGDPFRVKPFLSVSSPINLVTYLFAYLLHGKETFLTC